MRKGSEMVWFGLFMVGCLLVMNLANVLIAAGALQAMWEWFLVPVGAPDVMSYPLAMGVLLVAVLVGSGKVSVQRAGEEDALELFLRTIGVGFDGILTTLFVWGVACLVQFFV